MGGSRRIKHPWGSIQQQLAQMTNYAGQYDLDISGISSEYVEDGYLVINLWKPNEIVYNIHNHGASVATAIVKNQDGNESTMRINSGNSTGKMSPITHIKVSGTSDGLTVFTQDWS